ncbi:ABC transporter ATP-binding protein [Lysinibacillus sp. NPDC092081]|uniref:ABC transporter ATP-binding protein n=1 Tax=Lysinibacillus sp. NPDC092081 TaxID=3364131 RepID=UPI0037FE70A5
METILQFKNLDYYYESNGKKVTILDNVNFSFQKGLFYTILGPSGSGKTTTLSLGCGLDLPKQGHVLYNGKDIRKIGLVRYRNQHVSVIFQAYNLITYMTALQNVLTAMEITGVKVQNKKARALELLEKVGLTEVEAKRNVLQLSGGQQQRVAIARALSCNVDLLIADEPTGNLDGETAKEIIELFQELAHQENKCVIVVTHSQEVAKQSDRAVYLSKKKLEVKDMNNPTKEKSKNINCNPIIK